MGPKNGVKVNFKTVMKTYIGVPFTKCESNVSAANDYNSTEIGYSQTTCMIRRYINQVQEH